MPHQIVAIAGSLRAGSLNGMLAHAGSELPPLAITRAVFDELDRIPLFTEDPRPEGDSVLDGKPAAVIGATTAPWGTRYAQKEQRSRLSWQPRVWRRSLPRTRVSSPSFAGWAPVSWPGLGSGHSQVRGLRGTERVIVVLHFPGLAPSRPV